MSDLPSFPIYSFMTPVMNKEVNSLQSEALFLETSVYIYPVRRKKYM